MSEDNSIPFLGIPNCKVVLASSSTTRQNILRSAGVDFKVFSAIIDEESVRASAINDDMLPSDIAVLLATLKAMAVFKKLMLSKSLNDRSYIIGCDQILLFNNQIISKPTSIASAKKQLLILSGHEHKLLSAIVLIHDGQKIWHHLAEASLTMQRFDADFAEAYVQHLGFSALQSSGLYQIETIGSSLFSKITGDYFEILGLPLLPLLAILREHGLCPIEVFK